MRTKYFELWKCLTPLIVLIATTAVMADDVKTQTDKDKVDRKTEKRLSQIWKTADVVEGFEPVEMFSAMDAGKIEVVIKTRDAADANVMVTNKTDQPLAIEMPPAFAAVPALGQVGFGGGGGGGNRGGGGGFGGGGGGFGGGGNNNNQGTGGGFGGGGGGGGFGGGGGGRGGGGGGVFNIPPGRTGKVAVQTFCLEHGKADPEPRMDYVLKPLNVLSTDPEVYELCRMLANGEVTQPVAQAAGWNIANNLSWEFLLSKNRVELSTGYFERYFSPQQLEVAFRVVEIASERADQQAVSEKKPSGQEKTTPYSRRSSGAGS